MGLRKNVTPFVLSEGITASIHVAIDDGLEEKARVVAANMGFDLSSAIRVFLAQMVKENAFPFLPTNDGFYSPANTGALRHSFAELEAGATITKSLDDLRRLE